MLTKLRSKLYAARFTWRAYRGESNRVEATRDAWHYAQPCEPRWWSM